MDMEQIPAIYKKGVIELQMPVDWPDGSACLVLYVPQAPPPVPLGPGNVGHVIIAGFGLAGRFVADMFKRHNLPFVVVEKNPQTVQIQRELGATIIEGDICDEKILKKAGIQHASIFALTVPDEPAVLQATEVARKLNPKIYIVARTQYASVGMQASKLGADEVVQAEHAVAMQFYQSFLKKFQGTVDQADQVSQPLQDPISDISGVEK